MDLGWILVGSWSDFSGSWLDLSGSWFNQKIAPLLRNRMVVNKMLSFYIYGYLYVQEHFP